MAAKKEYISAKAALNFINEIHNVDPDNAGRPVIKLQTIYNAINLKRLKRYGPRHMVLLDPDDIRSVFGPKKIR